MSESFPEKNGIATWVPLDEVNDFERSMGFVDVQEHSSSRYGDYYLLYDPELGRNAAEYDVAFVPADASDCVFARFGEWSALPSWVQDAFGSVIDYGQAAMFAHFLEDRWQISDLV